MHSVKCTGKVDAMPDKRYGVYRFDTPSQRWEKTADVYNERQAVDIMACMADTADRMIMDRHRIILAKIMATPQ